jgi:hypothetical protein
MSSTTFCRLQKELSTELHPKRKSTMTVGQDQVLAERVLTIYDTVLKALPIGFKIFIAKNGGFNSFCDEEGIEQSQIVRLHLFDMIRRDIGESLSVCCLFFETQLVRKWSF